MRAHCRDNFTTSTVTEVTYPQLATATVSTTHRRLALLLLKLRQQLEHSTVHEPENYGTPGKLPSPTSYRSNGATITCEFTITTGDSVLSSLDDINWIILFNAMGETIFAGDCNYAHLPREFSYATVFTLPQLTQPRPLTVFCQRITGMLTNTPIPYSASRGNVIPLGAERVQSMLLGAYSQGKHVGITNQTFQRRELTSVLLRLVKLYFPNFRCNSIIVNTNYASRPHVDRNNVGESIILGMGPYNSGELWCADRSTNTQRSTITLHDKIPPYDVGEHEGSLVDIKERFYIFNGRSLHCTYPFTGGARHSVVWFNKPLNRHWSSDKLEQLRQFGFDTDLFIGSPVAPLLSLDAQRETTRKAAFRTTMDQLKEAGRSGCFTRCIIELCTSTDSNMGVIAQQEFSDCLVLRITKDHALDSKAGLGDTKQLVTKAFELYGPNVLFWDSHPCTGGCTFQRINLIRAKRTNNNRALERLQRLHVTQRLLLHNTNDLLEHAYRLGRNTLPCVAHEWPNSCTYWRLPDVQQFVQKYELISYQVDGCMVGVVTAGTKDGTGAGIPIRKSWLVKSNVTKVGFALHVRCDKSHSHAPCKGRDTIRSERYPEDFCRRVHRGWEQHCRGAK